MDRPEHWPWSSFRQYLTGEHCGVEIESRWTARVRERLGIFPTAQNRKEKPAQAELERGTLESRRNRWGGPPATKGKDFVLAASMVIVYSNRPVLEF